MLHLNPDYFVRSCELPPDLDLDGLMRAMSETARVVDRFNQSMAEFGLRLDTLIQRNNFSGTVSNILTKMLDRYTAFTDHSDYAYPDLIGPRCGLEVKCTFKDDKGAESHNGHSGWHLIASFGIDGDGKLYWTCIKIADLIGHNQPDSDWTYCSSKINLKGSRRTETYTTNRKGNHKLRTGVCFINTEIVTKWRKWGYPEFEIPEWSFIARNRIAS